MYDAEACTREQKMAGHPEIGQTISASLECNSFSSSIPFFKYTIVVERRTANNIHSSRDFTRGEKSSRRVRSHTNTRIYILIYCPPAVSTNSTHLRSASQRIAQHTICTRRRRNIAGRCAQLSSDYPAKVARPYATRIIYVNILIPVG